VELDASALIDFAYGMVHADIHFVQLAGDWWLMLIFLRKKYRRLISHTNRAIVSQIDAVDEKGS
jgi:hypothetical protein